MKNFLGFAVALLLLAISSTADASIYHFDFEDGRHNYVDEFLGSPNAYFRNTLGRSNASAGDSRWFGNSSVLGSDSIATRGYASTLDFDTNNRHNSDWHIDKLSFDWGIYDATHGRDFGLDVYDDVTGRWYNNIFEVRGARNGDSGNSGQIIFLSHVEITKLRFHNSGSFDVEIDNLWIHDNHITQAIPEPASAAVWALGIGMFTMVNRRRKQA